MKLDLTSIGKYPKRHLVFGLFVVVLGLVLLFLVAGGRDARRRRCTASVTGTVTSSFSNANDDGGYDYDLVVEYEIDGRKFRQNVYTSRRAERGESVTVRYDPDDYDTYYIEGLHTSPTMFRIAGIVFGLTGVYITAASLVFIIRDSRSGDE